MITVNTDTPIEVRFLMFLLTYRISGLRRHEVSQANERITSKPVLLSIIALPAIRVIGNEMHTISASVVAIANSIAINTEINFFIFDRFNCY